MKCSHCGSEFTGNFCTRCGTRHFSKWHPSLKSILVDPSETIISVLGNNFAQTFAATGQLSKGFAVLTNKRVYFKGTCLVTNSKFFRYENIERTVDLADVTGTGFLHNKATWALVLSILSAIISLIAFVGTPGLGVLLLLSALIFFGLYKLLSFSAFQISYAGGKIAFRLHWIGYQQSIDFQKQLVMLKQNQVNKQSSPLNEGKSIPELLKEYNDLLVAGIITQSEFDAKKASLLGIQPQPETIPVTPAYQPPTPAYTPPPATSSFQSAPAPTSGTWRCSCGREHPAYVSTCVCGKNKRDSQ